MPSGRWNSIIGVALVNIATFTWATNYLIGRWLRHEIGPFTLTAARFVIAGFVFAALLQREPMEQRRVRRDRWWLLAMALSGVVIFSPVLYLGLQFTFVVNATLVNSLGPLVTGLLAGVLIGEPMSQRQFGGAIISLMGVIVLISGSLISSGLVLSGSIGDFIMLGAVTSWAFYSVLGRRVMRQRSALSTTTFSIFLGIPFLILATLWELQISPPNFSSVLLAIIIYAGIFPTVIGYLAWNIGIRRLGPARVMVFYNTLPLYGALLGYLFLGESIGLNHLLGGTLIIGGGIWAARMRPKMS